ncbi:MAG TPA: spore coat associated protein CotJA [Candidatus Copromonas faecavium]|uniref:Spore coat associated protein CotJA n=1 Tax=Candidatus Copromonas faecavium (nom. illeg.) TaxID=2840740 RepID=A0A9D1A645_9FIRM|nr:spore coat associated protein CotJA [Candidatus Copromonas faecavium]
MNQSCSFGVPSGALWISPEKFPVGMGYVPVQQWGTPYSAEMGLARGTIFPALDYPFEMRGCRR